MGKSMQAQPVSDHCKQIRSEDNMQGPQTATKHIVEMKTTYT